jgi:hypothetical protein
MTDTHARKIARRWLRRNQVALANARLGIGTNRGDKSLIRRAAKMHRIAYPELYPTWGQRIKNLFSLRKGNTDGR